MTRHQPDFSAEKIVGGVATDSRHDSATSMSPGEAVYIDDMRSRPAHCMPASDLSTVAHGKIPRHGPLRRFASAPGVQWMC